MPSPRLHPDLLPLDLGQRPTPLQRLDRPSARLGVEIWVKRDDPTGLGLSGNKVRKLAFLMAQAQAAGATAVLTTGGIQSNHCRATAVAARQLGMAPHLLLRGSAPAPGDLDGNLLLDRILGARLRWCDAHGYRDRDALLAAWAAELQAAGERPFLIPEGGSNAVGALGFIDAARELRAQADGLGLDFGAVLCGVGSGGTLAASRPAGCPAGGGRGGLRRPAHLRGAGAAIAAEAAAWGHRPPGPGPDTWSVLEGHQGRGYALSTPEELAMQLRFSRETGLFLDPVYTGKTWVALEREIARNKAAFGKRVLFWHTGGIFGLFGRGAEISAALAQVDGEVL